MVNRRGIALRVEKVLKSNRKARSDEHLLQRIIWEQDGFVMGDEQYKDFCAATPAESIGRARRKLQSMGYYPASKKVQDRRFKLFTKIKETISRAKRVEDIPL